MPKKHEHHDPDHDHDHQHPEKPCDLVCRGRKISIQGDKGNLRLLIDGEEIPVERTERGGYVAHANMFQEYGSLEELAQDLIRDWGSAKIKHSKVPGGHHH